MTQEELAHHLVETYADAMLRLSFSYLKNTADAQDVCQTVLVKLLTRPRDFESPEHERAWVLKMTANQCRDLLKSAWRHRTCDLEACAQLAAPEEPQGSIWDAVSTLPDKYRAVVHLHYCEGYKAQEIAHILHIPVNTVYTRLARARAQLKELLEGEEYGSV